MDQSNEQKRDYLSYPEGFRNLAADLVLPFEDEAQREAYLWAVIDGLIKM